MKSLGVFSLLLILASFLVVPTAIAGGLELKPYGFIKGDMVYATKGVLSFDKPNLSAAQRASGADTAALGFTAMHTRFGLKGSTGDNVKVGGTLELDFFGEGFDANAKPRIRLAYAWMAAGNFELRFGQQWDIFSPNNATTNNTNGNMWYAGNLGFRRGQIQLLYKIPMESLAPMVQLAFCEGSKEAVGLGADNYATLPMIQGRLSAKLLKKGVVGVYFVHASYDPNPDVGDDEYNTTGLGLDFDLPFNPLLALKGEVNVGKNLLNANLFSISGNGSKNNDKKSLCLWVNAISKPFDNLNMVAGFGMDKNQTDNLSPGATEQNTVIYGDLIFPFGNGFSIALEAQSITTKIKGGDKNSALVLNVSGKVDF